MSVLTMLTSAAITPILNVEAVPVEAVPVEAVPVEAVPVEAAPVEAAPLAVPVQAVPSIDSQFNSLLSDLTIFKT